MGTPVITTGNWPSARTLFVDERIGGSLAARNVRVAGTQHYVTGSYLIVGVGGTAGTVERQTTPQLTAAGDFYAAAHDTTVVMAKKMVAPMECISGATLEPYDVVSTRFYPRLTITASASWWTGTRSTRFASVSLHDRRLSPFFERIEEIESGKWDAARGTRPSERALENARAVLSRLSGGPLIPKKVTAVDGRVVLYFTTGAKYSNLELLSSGVMLLLRSDGRGVPEVERVTPKKLATAIEQIHAHIA